MSWPLLLNLYLHVPQFEVIFFFISIRLFCFVLLKIVLDGHIFIKHACLYLCMHVCLTACPQISRKV